MREEDPIAGRSLHMPRVIAAFVWAITGRAGQGLVMMFVGVIMARLVSGDDLGRFFLLVNLITFIGITLRFGCDQAILRFVAQEAGRNSIEAGLNLGLRLIYRSIAFATTIGAIGFAILFHIRAYFSWLADADLVLIAVTLAIGVATAILISLAEMFRGITLYREAALADRPAVFLIFSLVVGTYLLAWGSMHLVTIMSTLLACIIAVTGAAIWRAQSRLCPPRIRLAEPQHGWFAFYSYGFPILITQLSLFAVTQSDLWIIGYYLSAEDLGLYGVAQRVAVTIGLTLAVVNAVTAPLIARLDGAGDKSTLETLLRGSACLAAIPSILLFTLLVTNGKSVLSTLFGAEFVAAYPILVILAGGQIVNVLCGSTGFLLLMHGYRHALMLSTLVIGVIVVVTAIWGAATWGANGVAIAFTVGLIVHQLTMLIIARIKCDIWAIADPTRCAGAVRVLQTAIT